MKLIRPKKKKAVLSNGLHLHNPSFELAEEVLRRFTFQNPEYLSALQFSPYGRVSESIPKTVSFAQYDAQKRVLTVPRGFVPEDHLTATLLKEFSRYELDDQRCKFRSKFPELKITLNKDQLRLLKGFKEGRQRRPWGNHLLIAHTSAGKTIAQAAIAAATGQRTLVICVTNLIRDSWYKDLFLAYGIAKKDIGVIQQSKWVIGEHFTLASMATLDKRRERWEELFSSFGCVILDEAHVASEPRVTEFLKACTCKYLVGATATLNKDSGDNFHLPSLLGTPVKRLLPTKGDTETSMKLRRVKVIKTDFLYEYDKHNLDQHDLALSLAADEERNLLIAKEAKQDWKNGDSVLIVVKRTQQLHLLKDMLLSMGVRDTNVLYGGTNSKKQYTEALIKMILSRKVRMLIATIPAIKLGANLNPLNRLHLAYPANRLDLEQLIGRIRRRAKKKRDTSLTYYLDKNVPYLRNRFHNKAIPVFRKMGVTGFANMF